MVQKFSFRQKKFILTFFKKKTFYRIKCLESQKIEMVIRSYEKNIDI